MKGYCMYSEIQQMKEAGFSQRAVARALDIHRKTVKRYWEMSVDEYQQEQERIRRSSTLDQRRERILGWLREYPGMTAAQVRDWLKEHYGEDYSERTVSRYVQGLREKYQLNKHEQGRDYAAVPELPMGQQVQVDFGEKVLKTVKGGSKKVYIAAFLLSHSRYKYVEAQGRPLTSEDLVGISHRCFAFFGGMPQELVFDQDSIVCVSENAGDILYTHTFEKFRQACGLRIHLCRKADPESKGKIENTVKYVKGNFLENRLYLDDETLNQELLKWLDRTANAKIHGTTKRIPKEVFTREKEHLRPLPVRTGQTDGVILRKVRKDNTIIFESNRYSVPLGTYYSNPEVVIQTENGELRVFSSEMEPICSHTLSSGKGLLIQNHAHLRDRDSGLNQLQQELEEALNHQADDFLRSLRKDKPRYARDQFLMLRSLLEQYGLDKLLDAIRFCHKLCLFSSNTIRDYIEYQDKQSTPPASPPPAPLLPVPDPVYHVQTQKRPVSDYAKVGAVK